MTNPLKGFEQVNFDAHQARNFQATTPVLGARAGMGSADFSAQNASRGIKPVTPMAAKGRAPQRSKGQSTGKASSQAELQDKGLTR
jgi:hypothetical protein